MDNNYFINPYTFIPIKKQQPERQAVVRGTRTGVIECTMTTMPNHPLFIPNTTNSWMENSGHSQYDFCSYDDLSSEPFLPSKPPKNPIIPGSTIRGMLRSLYEQLTNSCFLITNEEDLPYKRTSKPKLAGILDKKNRILYSAERYMLNTSSFSNFGTKVKDEKFKTGDLIYFTKTKSTYGEEKNKYAIKNYGVVNPRLATGNKNFDEYEGYVLIGEAFGRKKHHNSVMVKGNKWQNITDDDIQRLEAVLEKYVELYKDYKNAYEQKDIIPVFYSMVDDFLYMSPAQITKEVFANTIKKLLETNENYNHQPCNDKTLACPACRLFGMISKNDSGGAIAGRVNFADARALHVEWYNKNGIFTLPILGSPRLSTTEFYLKKPYKGADVWNYDYYTRDGNNAKHTPVLSGRKVYWHGKFSIKETNKTKMNQTIRLLKSGKFKFNVYFKDLTDSELSNLKFVLELNGEGIHKIGRGKPIGMGDVKITIDSIRERNYIYDENSGEFLAKAIQECEDIKDSIPMTTYDTKMILKYTKPMNEAESDLVDYPRTNNDTDTEIYKWFSANRGTVNKPKITHVLPDIGDMNQKLPKKIGEKSKWQKY